MNSQVPVAREWLDRVHSLLYKVAHEEGENGLEAECLGSRIPRFLQSLATPAPITDAVEGVDVIGYVAKDDLRWKGDCTLRHTSYSDYTIPLMTVAQHNRIVSALQASAMVVPDKRTSCAFCGKRQPVTTAQGDSK